MSRKTLGGAAAALLLLALAAWLALAFEDSWRSTRARWRSPRIVLLSLDTLNVWYTDPYGGGTGSTPVLAEMARGGVRFEHAYTHVPLTLPSHTSLLSGLSPTGTAVMANGDFVPAKVTTMPEILGAAGYRTAAFVSLGVLKGNFGLSQGFEHYDDDHQGRAGRWYRTADEIVDAASPWIREHAAEPFFLWVHLSDPHEPYLAKGSPPDVRLDLDGTPLGSWSLTSKQWAEVELELGPGPHTLTWTSLREPRPDDRRNTVLRLEMVPLEALRPWLADSELVLEGEAPLRPSFTLELEGRAAAERIPLRFRGRINNPPRSEVEEHYRAEVAFMDRHIGRLRELFRELEIDRETLWLVVSDHGEGLYRHGASGHASGVYEDQLRTVWILEGPGLPAGVVVEDAVALSDDLLPTVLDLLGLEAGARVEGRSRRGCWTGGLCEPTPPWWAYGLSQRNTLTAVAGYDWPVKWLWRTLPGRKRDLEAGFDLARDPAEQENLLDAEGGSRLEALAGQAERRRARFAQHLTRRSKSPVDPEDLDMLRALGYH